MNKVPGNSLHLQSYKIDTSTLQQNMKELNEMKSQLQTTISQYKISEQYLSEENQRLRDQIQMLHKKVEKRVDHNLCNQKIKILEEKLMQSKQQAEKYKQMYEVQRKNHNQLNDYYEKKMQLWKSDNNKLVQKYEQRISSLASQISMVKTNTQINVSPSKKTVRQNSADNYMSNRSHSNDEEEKYEVKQPKRYETNDKPKNPAKSYNAIPPRQPIPPKQISSSRQYGNGYEILMNNSQKNQTPNWRRHEATTESDQEAFEGSIRKLYFQIKQMGISAKQALMLPQMKKMSSNKAPSRKELMLFMKNSPIALASSQKAQKNVNFLEEAVRKQYGRISGNYVTQLIIDKVEEYEVAEKINSEEISVSGLTPSLNRGDSFGMSSISQSAASRKNTDNPTSAYKKKQRPSIADALKIESQGSIYKF